jgi:hypothetical protein
MKKRALLIVAITLLVLLSTGCRSGHSCPAYNRIELK